MQTIVNYNIILYTVQLSNPFSTNQTWSNFGFPLFSDSKTQFGFCHHSQGLCLPRRLPDNRNREAVPTGRISWRFRLFGKPTKTKSGKCNFHCDVVCCVAVLRHILVFQHSPILTVTQKRF